VISTSFKFGTNRHQTIKTFPSAGNVAVSPISALGLTNFSLALDGTGQFSTSTQVVGKVFAASYAPTTPATLSVAVGDMGTAFTDATGRVSPNFMNLGSGELIACDVL
jgi:hypothetical protein